MPYVITEICTRDGACVEVCPVSCIHTTPTSPQFYIDPDLCIECEQCVVVCPVDAIFLHNELPEQYLPFVEVNASFFRHNKAAVEPIRLEEATRIVEAAAAYAAQLGAAVTVAVVDEAGAPIAVSRMDGAHPRTAELALNKAYTAVSFQLFTDQLGPDMRQPWFHSLVISSHGRIMGGGGGIPLTRGFTVLGAVGVAGSRDDGQDALCCRAGLAAFVNLDR